MNNAIVLLDYILQLRRDGMGEREAIMEAGRLRFRPVVLTAVTTVLGLIPLTTGFSVDFGNLLSGNFGHAVVIGGESSQWWGPMGVAVIWGLIVATFLTLVIVPTLYADIQARETVLLPAVREADRRRYLGCALARSRPVGQLPSGAKGYRSSELIPAELVVEMVMARERSLPGRAIHARAPERERYLIAKESG